MRVLSVLYITLLAGVSTQVSGQLRELSPDRPDQTESPISIDKGHFAIEADLVNFNRQHLPTDEINTPGIGAINLKYGFHRRMDLQLVTNVWNRDKFLHGTHADTTRSFDDLTWRVKINVLGNDSGKIAIGLLPFVRTNNFFRSGLSVENIGMVVNIGGDITRNVGLAGTTGLSYVGLSPFFGRFEYFTTCTVDLPLAGALRNFVEGSYRYGTLAPQRHTYSIDYGITYLVNYNLMLDTGCYYYLSNHTLFLFIGGTFRL